MTQPGPTVQDSHGVLIQRGVGRIGRNVLALVIGGAGLIAAIVLGVGQGRYSLYTTAGGILGVFGLLGGLLPVVVWRGVQVRIDSSGVLFGSPRPREKPPIPFSMLRQRYFVPWGALGSVHVIEGRGATRAMRRSVAPTVTRHNGFFPRSGATAHLSFVVDPHRVTLPWQRTYTSGVWTMRSRPTAMSPSIVWVFPIHDVEGTISALQAHGVEVARDNQPAVAVPWWPAELLAQPPGE